MALSSQKSPIPDTDVTCVRVADRAHAGQSLQRTGSLIARYLAIAASILIATGLRAIIIHFYPDQKVLLVYIFAIILGTWLAGWPGGVFALILSCFASVHFFAATVSAFDLTHPQDRTQFVIFCVAGLLACAITDAQGRAHRKAERAARIARQDELALRESEERYQAILDSTMDGLVLCDSNEHILSANPAAARIFGFDDPAQICRSRSEITRVFALYDANGKELPVAQWPLSRALAGERFTNYEVRARRRDIDKEFIASYSGAPIPGPDGKPQLAVVTFHDITELKAAQEALAEAFERESELRKKEQHIAAKLQEALQPKIPNQVGSLALADHYAAALDESSVGGDFCDVFDIEPGLWALAVGDVSGKGLSAAAQVAMVRNMLRSSLYQGRYLADALTTLNRILTEHDLLAGFVTLFVGVYREQTGTLIYASCGHEPALLYQAATRQIVMLEATGLPLGIDSNLVYGDCPIRMQPSDVLLLYTDGLSEAGPSRSRLLATEGLRELFAHIMDANAGALPDVREIRSRLIERVQEYAGGALEDDACLLIACRTK